MLRATLLVQLRALGAAVDEVVLSPLPEAGPYLVRLDNRAAAERLATALLASGQDRILHADPVGDGLLFLTPAADASLTALDEVATATLPPLPASMRQHVLLEYVSADPNTALTLVHARQGVVGDALARILAGLGHTVKREYYVNDAPKAALTTFVAAVASREGAWADALASTVSASPGLDEVVAAARYRHGEALARLGIGFDSDASENDLRRRGAVEETLQALRQSGYADEQSGALWLRASALGDDQDRVLVRTDGPTYLAGDLAYHRDKFNRGFTRLIDLWDADHRSYIARTHAGLKALGCPDDALQVLVCGTVRCLKDGTEVRGGRYGGFVSLEEVLDECAPADLRWRLIRVAPDEPLDLPLGDESLVERLRTARDRASSKADPGAALPEPLGPESAALLSHLLEWPARVLEAAENLHPHVLALWAETLETHIAAHDLPPRLAAAAAGTLSRTFQLLGIA